MNKHWWQPAAGPALGIDTRWKIEEFGLFQPNLPIDEQHPDGDIISLARETIYRNVGVFCERVKDAIATKDAGIGGIISCVAFEDMLTEGRLLSSQI
jgi:hypothetical protein